MRKATRQLLKYLKQTNSKAFVVNVKPLDFDEAQGNHYYQNAMKFLDKNENWVLRSGWIVGEFFGDNGTAVMPHYWVFNPIEKCDYDVTPLEDNQSFEYVVDLEIARNIDEKRTLSVPVSLKIKADGRLLARIGENKFLPLKSINHKTLYDLVD